MKAMDAIMGRDRESSDTPSDSRKTRIMPTGGRVSIDVNSKLPIGFSSRESTDGKRVFQYIELDLAKVRKMAVHELFRILIDADPDVSLALFHFLCFTGVGYRFQVLYPGTERQHRRGSAIIEDFLDLMEDYYGGFDILMDRMFYSFFIGGASFMEIVLDSQGRNIVDFVVNSPFEARFREASDPDRGKYWQLGQYQNEEFVPLDIYDTVKYVPFHPGVGSPYGRAFLSPTVFTSLFLISMLKDLERVIRTQGWKRLDIILDVEKLDLPSEHELEPGQTHQSIINNAIQTIQDKYKVLGPDDVFVHTNEFEFGDPVGVADRFSFQGIADVIRILERRIIRALKSQPLLMGNNDGTTETHANRQWEIYTTSIQSVQKRLGTSIANLLRVALQGRGILADVTMIFDEFRDSERIRDLQADKQELDNIQFQVDNGYLTSDEARDILRRKLKGFFL